MPQQGGNSWEQYKVGARGREGGMLVIGRGPPALRWQTA